MMRPQIVLMVASLFSSSPGECRCPTGHCSTDPSCKPIHEHFAIVPGYNVPDQIAINDCWSIFAFGEFTYQIPLQENMELGFVNDRRNTSVHQDGAWINPDFEYKPGFKLGIGVSFDQDHWDLHAEYAWYRGIQDTSRSVDLTGSLEIYPLAPLANIQSTVFGKAKQSWRLEMDILDLTLSRH